MRWKSETGDRFIRLGEGGGGGGVWGMVFGGVWVGNVP